MSTSEVPFNVPVKKLNFEVYLLITARLHLNGFVPSDPPNQHIAVPLNFFESVKTLQESSVFLQRTKEWNYNIQLR